ncbi:MAG: PEP-CTERM sorting domain-containing protein [Planctomycetota bacterium]|jgi:hypothetical protein
MKTLLLLAVVLILAISAPTFGAIVYSGAQNVTLQLAGGGTPPPQEAVIPIADSGGDWDDFMVVLSFDGMMMAMSHLAIYSPMGMAMGGIVGLADLASSLSRGEVIGPDSLMADWGYLYGPGEFGPDGGYIGLMMDIPDGSPHYGWLHVSSQWDMGTSLHGLMLDGWAYEDQAYTPIGAGEIPEPSSFLLCSIGGLVAWLRRRRSL